MKFITVTDYFGEIRCIHQDTKEKTIEETLKLIKSLLESKDSAYKITVLDVAEDSKYYQTFSKQCDEKNKQ